MRISIRNKLLLASLSLLVLPWLGYQYVQGLEAYLRSAQDQQLLDRVAIMAAMMNDRQAPFSLPPPPADIPAADTHVYVRPLHSPIQVDGYPDDWRPYADRRLRLGGAAAAQDLEVHYSLGVWHKYLYLLFEIHDDHIVYRPPTSHRTDRSDHLRISVLDRNGRFRRYRISTIAPGWVHTYIMPAKERHGLPLGVEPRIKAQWQEVAGGYDVELRIPLNMVGERIAFAVADVDDPASGTVKTLISNGDTEKRDGLGTIALPSAATEQILQRLQRPLSRIWLVDRDHRVVGLADNMSGEDLGEDDNEATASNTSSSSDDFVPLLYRLLLDQPAHRVRDRLSSASRFDDPAVTRALAGKAAVSRRRTLDEKISIVTAAHPVYADGRLVGALAVEETSNSVLILQNRAVEALVNMSLLAFALTIGLLLAFATRLSLRVRRLRNQVEASIGADGRVQGEITFTGAGDELGDLGRSFHAMHERLAQYNRYLETMAGKLSHELRTPISIVRSSLDNLEADLPPPERQVYLQRAHEGVARLNGILTRMSEATHLEQTVLQEPAKPYVPATVIAGCVDAYRLAHPQQPFEFDCEPAASQAMINGSAELLAQLLDKLVDNALDFVKPETAIRITVTVEHPCLVLGVANEGARLPREMRTQLFESMVSLRQGKNDRPHLGLGLYIVRLIAEYHGGHVEVADLADPEGVLFRVVLPLS
ncbi:MAG: proteobacterial dedicated sortase system histidine kinase [Gammaproteobacteria bacterium]